jgi:two-component system OmpR family sensor kinase
MTRWPSAVRWRLTLWYTAALAVGLAAFALASLLVLRESLERRSDRFLQEARSAFVAELAVEADEIPNTVDAIRAAVDEVRFDDTRFFVYDGRGAVVAATAAVPPAGRAGGDRREPRVDEHQLGALVSSRAVAADRPAGTLLHTLSDAAGGYRIAAGDLTVHGRPHTVVAAHSRHAIRETLRLVSTAYALAIPILLSLAVAVGYALARRALAPVAAMSQRAREIGASTLHDRLPVANAHDELGELAGVVNELLARLDAAFAQQRRFVADASHELRTPVAILRAEADVTLGRATRSEAEYRDAIAVMRDAGQRLSRIVEDLFLLARADAGHQPVRREALYLDELVADAVRAMRALAAQRGVSLALEIVPHGAEGAPYSGDPALLHRLVLNLLDNAVKFTHAGGAVHVCMARHGDAYWIAVRDDGPGIPAVVQPHVFERFFRADASRTRVAPGGGAAADDDAIAPSGAGLGLSIARWIAEAHGGELGLAYSTPEGTEFVATLPIGGQPTVDGGTSRTATARTPLAPASSRQSLPPRAANA